MLHRSSLKQTTVLTALVFGLTSLAAPILSMAAAPIAAGKDLAVSKPVMACADLAKVDLAALGGAGSKVTSAKEEVVNKIAMCSVNVTLAPTISISLKLPTATWTQRYMQVGCGGLCGHVMLEVGAADNCAAISDGGFVLAATNMGHDDDDPKDGNGAFGRDPQKLVDFAYLAQHKTADVAKLLINTYYGKAQAYSYFNGCSDGGREALMEAQRYPNDFNGIIAGAPAMLFQFQNSLHHGWQATQNRDANGKAILLAAKLPVLHSAVVKACDKFDGVADGLLSDPRLCSFEPKAIVCAEGAADTSTCLTAAEANVAAKFYNGPKDATTGQRLLVGGPQYGSELSWAGVFIPETAEDGVMSQMITTQALGNLIIPDAPADYGLKDLKFDASYVHLLKARHPLLDATNPDLSAFANAGGKLILWHGWADEHISPITTIAYHEAMEATMGADKVASFNRMYLLPGVGHCGRGEGPSAIDLVSAMMNWVEKGQAADAIASSTESGPPNNFGQPMMGPPGGKGGDKKGPPPEPKGPTTKMTRPVFPYPAIATYKGTGDVADAANYDRGAALYSEPVSDWAGADFFKPYKPRMN